MRDFPGGELILSRRFPNVEIIYSVDATPAERGKSNQYAHVHIKVNGVRKTVYFGLDGWIWTSDGQSIARNNQFLVDSIT